MIIRGRSRTRSVITVATNWRLINARLPLTIVSRARQEGACSDNRAAIHPRIELRYFRRSRHRSSMLACQGVESRRKSVSLHTLSNNFHAAVYRYASPSANITTARTLRAIIQTIEPARFFRKISWIVQWALYPRWFTFVSKGQCNIMTTFTFTLAVFQNAFEGMRWQCVKYLNRSH